MSYRLWYRTYTDYVDIVPNMGTFNHIWEAEAHAQGYLEAEAARPDQYVKTVEIQHVPCGENHLYCECEADL